MPAKHQRAGRRGKTPRLIVIHSTESPEQGNGAEAVAKYFQNVQRTASAHRVADNNSTVMCVRDENTAFGAAGANDDGLHLEQVGYAKQTEADWLDTYSVAMLTEGGKTIREWADEYAIPLVWLTVAQVADGKSRGLCTHADVSAAFPKISTGHHDPGAQFPKERALAIWRGDPTPEDPLVPAGYTLVFVTDGPDQPWWLTDGMTRRGPIKGSEGSDPSDAQELFDIGLSLPPDEKHPNQPRPAKVVSPQFLGSIPVAD